METDLFYKKFGKLLRNARKASGMTQQALADRVNKTRTSITNIEKGRQHIPLHMLFSLASAVGTKPSDLLPNLKPEPAILEQIEVLEENNEKSWLRKILSQETREG